MFPVYFLILVLPTIWAQVTAPGRCPAPYTPPDFDINQFLGTWYQIAGIPSPLTPGRCITAHFSLKKEGDDVDEQIFQIINGQVSTIKAKLRTKDKREPAILERHPIEGGPSPPLWILHIDYKTYAIFYMCENHENTHSQFVWIMGRSPTLDQTVIDRVKSELIKQGIHADAMKMPDQSCFTSQPK